MTKQAALFTFILFFVQYFIYSQTEIPTALNLNDKKENIIIKRKQEQKFNINLKKDIYYSIEVQQQGIDLVIILMDKNGHTIKEMDTPNGKFGLENIVYSPNETEIFTILVKPLEETENSQQGNYSILAKEIPKTLPKYGKDELYEDLNILQTAYDETRVGLWYNSRVEFDSIFKLQKSQIKENMDGLEFYRILRPIVAFTKEGHSTSRSSKEIRNYLAQTNYYMPFFVKIIDKKVYIINDLDGYKTQGYVISKIDGKDMDVILDGLLKNEPSDGYIKTGKAPWLQGSSFSNKYSLYFDLKAFFDLELINPRKDDTLNYKNIKAYKYKKYKNFKEKIKNTIPNNEFEEPSTFEINTDKNVAILSINTMATRAYENGRAGFKSFLKNVFNKISQQKIENLIIDLRQCTGGAQGMEDHLLSYLITEPYQKYKYVEIPDFTYTFLKYTDHSGELLKRELKEDFYQAKDGRYLNKPKHYTGDLPKANPFKGNIYILTGGLTASGGSEFAALAKNYTNATFIGEETGGGYYGNTSGHFLNLKLPNTKINIGIPLHKFVIVTKENDVPFGRGIIPDYEVKQPIEDFMDNVDTIMDFTLNLIESKK